MECSFCGNALSGEEIESPRKDKDGTLLCDACFDDKYTHSCPICEDFFDEDLDAKISPKHIIVLEEQKGGIPIGIYEIISYPFYADGMIEFHIFKGALKRICDAPTGIESHYSSRYVCDKCVTKQKQKQKSDVAWIMR